MALKTVDFSGHSDLYQGPGENTVKIKMKGSRGADFTKAYKKAGIKGSVKTQVDSQYTWHHMHDFDPNTGETTMQLVKTKTHEASLPHKGSVSQFEKFTGTKYESFEAKEFAHNKGWRSKKPRLKCKS
ncbi:hypothetical protein BWK58_13825 [Flavobacterium columnare]|nr:hypothetical protein BWK58_13825 [Flavobacterium columnare]